MESKKKNKPIIKKKSKKKENKIKETKSDLVIFDDLDSSYLDPHIENTYKKSIYNMNPIENRNIIDDSKDYILKTCNSGDLYSIFFTSGESESNVMFLQAVINSYKNIRKVKPHVITSSIEHASIIRYINSLKDSDQIDVTFIKPNIYGCILSEYILSAIKPNTCCVSISFVNHELGSINNIEKISAILHDKKIPLHSDCSYLFGKYKLDLIKTNIDAVTISFDKINGPTGFGAIIVKKDLLTGYKITDYSFKLDDKRLFNIPLILASVASVKSSLNNRTDKNILILNKRNEIINTLSKHYILTTYADYLNSDNNEALKNKLIILGPPINDCAYYAPSILTFILINENNKKNINIKNDLEKKKYNYWSFE